MPDKVRHQCLEHVSVQLYPGGSHSMVSVAIARIAPLSTKIARCSLTEFSSEGAMIKVGALALRLVAFLLTLSYMQLARIASRKGG
jgi:hypothetical protein